MLNKITKFYWAICLTTNAMLADYIKFKKTQPTVSGNNECRRNFFKLMNVVRYKKTIENVAKHMRFKVLIKIIKARRLA